MQQLEVAVLLATFNGSRYLDQQIRSLKNNLTPFKVHWLDDQSTDNSRDLVRALAQKTAIQLREVHRSDRQGVPGAFFELLESVEADIYLFCDQDDIWQPGKIDATVADLLSDLRSPILCCSDSLLFRNDDPSVLYRFSDVVGTTPQRSLRDTRLFTSMFVNGHTQGFTRPLREIFLKHKEIARSYAFMHDEWMHAIAVASGRVRMLVNSPTTLYRWHGGNVSAGLTLWHGSRSGRMSVTQRQLQSIRRALARHAQGFVLASSTLPPSKKLNELVQIAKLVASIDRRQSLASVARFIRRRITLPNRRLALQLTATCLVSDAVE